MTAPTPIRDDVEQRGDTFTAPQVLAMVRDLTYRQLSFWASCGYLPDQAGKNPVGQNGHRTYTARDVDTLHAVVALVAARIDVREAFRIAPELVEHGVYTHHLHDIYEITIRVTPPTEEPTP